MRVGFKEISWVKVRVEFNRRGVVKLWCRGSFRN